MPWKVSTVVLERASFIKRLQAGERMSDLCIEFGISRKTGYKLLDRFSKLGDVSLLDESRRPNRLARLTSESVQNLIVNLRKDRPTWGASKIKEVLMKKHPGVKFPVRSTIHEILDRHGLVKERKRGRGKAHPTFLSNPNSPNDLWCADFKGQFRLGNNQYCYPLTVTDAVSRAILGIEALESTAELGAKQAFRTVFQEHGLPLAIRTDNGVPFSTRGLLGLSKLSVWWLKLGIRLERIQPGKPQQNGRHERMHLTLKQETTRPPKENILQQQERFDEFIEIFNNERPHEALQMKTPSEIHQRSIKQFPKIIEEPTYPFHDRTCHVCHGGVVHVGKQGRFHLSHILGGELVGLREVEEQLWLVSFTDMDLGHYDEKEGCFFPVKI
jgi:transposase InsO family protein